MSFILNALRKSEQDRLTSHTETLEDKISFKQVTEQKHKPGWLMSLLIVNIIVLALILWHFTRQEEQDIDAKRLAVAEPVGVAKQEVDIEQTVDNDQAFTEKPVFVSEQAKISDQIKQDNPVQVLNSSIDTTPHITIAEQVKNHQAKKKAPSKKPAPIKSDPAIQPVKESLSISIEEQKHSAEQEVKTLNPQIVINNKENDLPYLSEMPLEFRLSVPKININVFVYTDQPEGRFIMIKMRKYQTGQKIFKQIELKEIRPDSIVVEYQDKVFQIRR